MSLSQVSVVYSICPLNKQYGNTQPKKGSETQPGSSSCVPVKKITNSVACNNRTVFYSFSEDQNLNSQSWPSYGTFERARTTPVPCLVQLWLALVISWLVATSPKTCLRLCYLLVLFLSQNFLFLSLRIHF